MKIDLSGKIALITGGSSGIGEACVKVFSEANAKVFFTFNTNKTNAAKIAKQTNAVAIECDVSSDNQCKNTVNKVIEQSGRLDILVNNAGIYMDAEAGAPEYLDVWQKVISINLNACAAFANFAVPHMKTRKSGKIVNISSIHAIEGTSGASAYHASKAGLDGLTRALAVELAPYNIQVNSVGPGPIKTPMWGDTSSGYALEVAKMAPARRFGEPEEIAYSAIFLASPFADYITGQTLFVDGGMLINVFKQ